MEPRSSKNHGKDHQAEKKKRTYSQNTQAFVFEVARIGQVLAELATQQKNEINLKPVIIIDGPAGAGKSTFTLDLDQRLRELNLGVCLFEQDRFGVFRDIRKANKINPCSDLARDPKTVDKLKEVMRGETALLPEYNTTTGVRIKDKMPLASGDVILYEGVSSLSYVIYENQKLAAQNNNGVNYQEYIAIRIFFTTDTEETLYASRRKRDITERSADLLDYEDNWDDNRRNNWMYTLRGIDNANFVVTRTKDATFEINQIAPIVFLGKEIKTEFNNNLMTEKKNEPENKRDKKFYKQQRNTTIQDNVGWVTDQGKALVTSFEFEKKVKKQQPNLNKNERIRVRDDLFNDMRKSQRIKAQNNLNKREKQYASDTNILPDHKALGMMVDALHREQGKRGKYSQDDINLKSHKYGKQSLDPSIANNPYTELKEKSMFHDKKFNDKKAIAIENTLAATVIDNINLFSSPIAEINAALLKIFKPLHQKVLAKEATVDELKVYEFIIAPFNPQTKSLELGTMPVQVVDANKITNLEVGEWLISAVERDLQPSSKVEPNTDFYTQMRFQIRMMDLICELHPELNITMIPESTLKTFQQLFKKLRIDAAFAQKENNLDKDSMRGRKMIAERKNFTTTSFGTYVNVHDLPLKYRKFIGLRVLPEHNAGKSFLVPVATTLHNQKALEADFPLIGSVSGAMALLLCAYYFAIGNEPKYKEEKLKVYHLVCLSHLIAGGHHSMAECLVVSNLVFDFAKEGCKMQDLTPKLPRFMVDKNTFVEFMKLAAEEPLSIVFPDQTLGSEYISKKVT